MLFNRFVFCAHSVIVICAFCHRYLFCWILIVQLVLLRAFALTFLIMFLTFLLQFWLLLLFSLVMVWFLSLVILLLVWLISMLLFASLQLICLQNVCFLLYLLLCQQAVLLQNWNGALRSIHSIMYRMYTNEHIMYVLSNT